MNEHHPGTEGAALSLLADEEDRAAFHGEVPTFNQHDWKMENLSAAEGT
jgi:hypothetical protein